MEYISATAHSYLPPVKDLFLCWSFVPLTHNAAIPLLFPPCWPFPHLQIFTPVLQRLYFPSICLQPTFLPPLPAPSTNPRPPCHPSLPNTYEGSLLLLHNFDISKTIICTTEAPKPWCSTVAFDIFVVDCNGDSVQDLSLRNRCELPHNDSFWPYYSANQVFPENDCFRGDDKEA
ncbi:hypothetical protein FF1_037871 [Malus domestica]